MNFKEVIKKEPITTFSLVISISVALFSSPIFLDWYFGPKVVVVADFKQSNDQRCAPFKFLIRNEGSRTAETVCLLYDSDFLTSGSVSIISAKWVKSGYQH